MLKRKKIHIYNTVPCPRKRYEPSTIAFATGKEVVTDKIAPSILLFASLAIFSICAVMNCYILFFVFRSGDYVGGFRRSVRGNFMASISKNPTFVVHAGSTAKGLHCSLVSNNDLLSSSSPYRYLNSNQGCNSKEDGSRDENIESLHANITSYLEDGGRPIYTSGSISHHILQVYREGKGSNMRNSILPVLHHVKEEGNWNAQVVMEYQRYYEFVPLYYHQQLETFLKGASFRDLSSLQIKPFLSQQSFISDKEGGDCSAWGDYSNDMHPLQLNQEAFKEVLGINLELINPYPSKSIDLDKGSVENDPLYNFSRQLLPATEEFRRRFTAGEGIRLPGLYDDSSEIYSEYMHLSVAAYSIGLISIRAVSPWNMVQSLATNHDSIMHLIDGDVPLSCPPEEKLINLFETSLRFERELFPEWSSNKFVMKHHLQGFTQYVEENKFCDWDVKKMLKNDKIRDFIRRLSSNAAGTKISPTSTSTTTL